MFLSDPSGDCDHYYVKYSMDDQYVSHIVQNGLIRMRCTRKRYEIYVAILQVTAVFQVPHKYTLKIQMFLVQTLQTGN